MKLTSLTLAVLFSTALLADEAANEVSNAAKKLAEKANYSWKMTIETGGGGGRFRPGPTEGKTADGITYLSMTRGDNSIEAVLKDGKGAVKTQDGWRSIADAAQDQGQGPGGGRFIARMVQNLRTPAEDAKDLASRATNLKKENELITGTLSSEAVTELLSRGARRAGGSGPDIKNAKGSVKFWVKDGMLSKYEYQVQGTANFNGEDREIDRTTTVEIKEVGTTKVSIPEGASGKLG